MGDQFASRVATFVDRWRIVVLLVLFVALGATTTAAAAAKPFWHDEIYTILVAQLPSVTTIWAAQRDGIDLAPPLSALATRSAWSLFGTGPIATRLPALLGFWTMTLMIFVILRSRANATLALAGALVPMQTAAFRYSYEARGYGLMIGLFAVALWTWGEAARGHRRAVHLPLLAVSLSAGVWAHYYAAVVFVLLGVSEVVRQARQGRADWPMWAAFGAAALAVVPLVPLARVASQQASGFWAQGGGSTAGETYRFLLEPGLVLLFSAWGGAIALLLAMSWIVMRWPAAPRVTASVSPEPAQDAWGLPAHEVVAIAGALLLPLAMLLVSTVSAGPFTPRYALPAVVGFALALPLLVRWTAPRGAVAELVLLSALVLPLAQSSAAVARAPRAAPSDPVAERPVLAEALTRPGRIAASGSLTFLQLWHYAAPPLRGRLVYVADPAAALRITGSDTFDRGYLALARWTAVPVEAYETFIERSPEFSVYAAGSGWLLHRLEDEGRSIALVASESGGRLFRVTW